VGEVDQLDDAVDERVADRHERPDGTVGEAVDEVVPEPGEVVVLGDEIAERVVDGQDQQDHDQAVLRYGVAHCLTRGGWAPGRNAGGFHV
jgi:hypothetical protein